MRHPRAHSFLKWAGPAAAGAVVCMVGLIAALAQSYPEVKEWGKKWFNFLYPIIMTWWPIIIIIIVIYVVCLVHTSAKVVNSKNILFISKRIELVNVLDMAIKAGWPPDRGNVNWLKFTNSFRQAAVDGYLTVWGRINSSDFDQLVARNPLVQIEKSHWETFEIDAISLLNSNRNFDVGSYNLNAHDWGKRERFRDLHVLEEEVEQWLQNSSPNDGK